MTSDRRPPSRSGPRTPCSAGPVSSDHRARACRPGRDPRRDPWHKRIVIERAILVSLLAVSTAVSTATSFAAPPGNPRAGAPAPRPRMEPDDLPGPQPELSGETARVDLPAIPAFALPGIEPGFHGPRELHLQGRHLLGTEIKVKGYITWIYDCAAQLASLHPEKTPQKIASAIQKDPTLCERAKFLLGDARDTPRDASIWVVDVPRIARLAERGTLRQSDLKGVWPDVPRIAIGDYVMITGTWAL